MENANKFSKNQIVELLANSQKIFSILWENQRKLLVGITIMLIVVTFLGFSGSFLNGLVFNQLVIDMRAGHFSSWLWVVLGGLALNLVLTRSGYSFQSLLQKILYRLNGEYFESLLLKHKGYALDIAAHEDREINNLINRVSENIWRVNGFIERQSAILQGCFEVILASLVVIAFQWAILPILIIAAIPALWIEGKYGRVVWNIHSSRSEQRRAYFEYRRNFSYVTGIRDMTLFENRDFFFKKIKNIFKEFLLEENNADKKRLILKLSGTLLSEFVLLGSYIYFINQTIHGLLEIGTLTFLYASLNKFSGAIAGLFFNIGGQYQDSLFITDMFDLLNSGPKVQTSDKGCKLNKNDFHSIRFDHVTFKYPGSDQEILHDVCITIQTGEKIAFVGENGAGKTTLIKLLLREYDPTIGNIYVDDINLKDIDIVSLRDCIAHLFQEYSNYRVPVGECIALSDIDGENSEERIRNAAMLGGADVFIEKWSDKYSQQLGRDFGGVSPSGGEWQRIALSKVFYRNRPIVILDEPTASVDPLEEAEIFSRFKKDSKKLIILITHKLSAVKNCDKIFVINDGRIIEEGSHKFLIMSKGEYFRMFQKQREEYLN